jgi:uracil-DNA glycosylase family 4
VAQEKRHAYQHWDYWGRPVPNLGNPPADLLVVGLAPAAHGANRTGRMFTGDRSGEWLFRALHRAGFANQAYSAAVADGLQLRNCVITAICHCAPPANRPTAREIQLCAEWYEATVALVKPRVWVALGQLAWQHTVRHARRAGWWAGPSPRFAHGAALELTQDHWILASYHPSQQNTFTGRLTEKMLDRVFQRARQIVGQADLSSAT